MAKVSFDPIIKWFAGTIGKLVYRRSHNGKTSVYKKPDNRQRMKEASKYASAAIADPEIRQVYVQMALERDMDPKRPFDVAVQDYRHGGEDLLWKKHMDDQPKPHNWNMYHYAWYFPPREKSNRQRQPARRGKW